MSSLLSFLPFLVELHIPFSTDELSVIFRLVLTTVRVLPETIHTPTTDMAFQDVHSAHQLVRSVLTEVEFRDVGGQISFDINRRVGWGSFGDVYIGQYLGIVSGICLY